MRALLTIIRKDLRLLWRDRAGLIFLTIAPIMVITVAGFSLANLYGADPTGQTAYDFPVVDEDGGQLANDIRTRLAAEHSVRLRPLSTRAEAQRLIENKQAGSALVIPQGTEAALHAGRSATLILYTDPVKYLERLNVHARLLEVRDALANEQRARLGTQATAERQRLTTELERLRAAVAHAQDKAEAAWKAAQAARQQAASELRTALARSQQQAEEHVRHELNAAAQAAARDLETQAAALQGPAREYFGALQRARTEFELWFQRLKQLAGNHAADIPPPPSFPEIPRELDRLIAGAPLLQLPDLGVVEISVPAPHLPPPPNVPQPPAMELPEIALPDLPSTPGTLAIAEVNLGGGSTAINTFDQNVPGFSVTFLLLGMLLGVSLGLLDERDWGTFNRLRALPIAAGSILLGKLLSRFVVGFIQMVVLFAVGRVAFGISLGPQPWALLLPTAGIVFAGTAFGLIVAACAGTREAVLPVGSIVIVTMAAMGGCWWPIDLEPRWMRTAALAMPTTWAMDAFNDLMIRHRSVQAALTPTAVMLAFGLLYLTVGLAMFRRRMRREPA